MNKLLTVILISLTLFLCSGCGAPADTEPEATLPPGITKPEGSVLSTDPKIVCGRITKLTDKVMCISVQNVEWELTLGEEALYTLEKFAEYNIEVRKGTFVKVYYEEESGKRIAGRIERVTAN